MPTETILLVDDDGDVRGFTKMVLERSGYSVLTAADGEEGLRVYKANKASVALLLSDVRMPKMNGLDLANRVLELGSKVAVLLMSGDGPAAPGVYEHISKPFKVAELVDRIREVMNASHGLKGNRATAVVAA